MSDERETMVSRRTLLAGLAAGGVVLAGGAVLALDRRGDDDPEPSDATADAMGETSYGTARLQRGELSVPVGHSASREAIPVVVLVHGGFWRSQYDRTLMEPLAAAVVEEGWAAWNLDFRSSDDGGGWSTTFTDVAAGVDHVAAMAEARGLDPARVAVVGHSAGGTLALWSAARRRFRDDVPGADPVVRPVAAVSIAGVTSLVSASLDGLGGGAVEALMGGTPGDLPEEYAQASPSDLLPFDTAHLLVHGQDDPLVPLRQSTAHAARAEAAGDDVTLEVVPRTDHFDPIDPASRAWRITVEWLREHLA